jgi:hypothetical protein
MKKSTNNKKQPAVIEYSKDKNVNYEIIYDARAVDKKIKQLEKEGWQVKIMIR